MATDNINLGPSTPSLDQPQHVPKPRRRSQRFKQFQDSSMSAKPFHPGNKIIFGQSDPQGLFGSSGGVNPKLLENVDKETSMSRLDPSVLGSSEHQIAKNKEAGAVIIKQESFVSPLIPQHSLTNEKQKQLQDSFPPTFTQIKLAYQQGLLSSSVLRLQEDPKLLEGLDKEMNMYRPSSSVLQSPEDQMAKNKEASAVVLKLESSLVPDYSLRNEIQKQLQDSSVPIVSQMKLAYQQGLIGSSSTYFRKNPRPGPSVIVPPVNQIQKNKEAAAINKHEDLVSPLISEESLRKGKQKEIQESFPPTFSQMNLASQPPSAPEMNEPCSLRASEINLLWLLQQQMQLSRTYEKRPEALPEIKSIYNPETCIQRLKQYLYCQQQRPRDNNIQFWKKLVAEFFAPNAKMRTCLASNKHRQQISCIFPQEAWCCGFCHAMPTAGFEMSAQVFPRLCKIKFETGMLDELLYFDVAEESYTPGGHIILTYTKVREACVYETARVVREGRLRIVFSSDLKICIWEFCCSFLEVLINRTSVILQFHQLKEAIKKYHDFAATSSGIATEEFRRNSNTLDSSIRELARLMDKSLINDLGYTKRYLRCVQISEIVSSMKDLMDHSKKYEIGAADAMGMIHRESTASRVAHNSVAAQGHQQHIDESQNSSVISFAPYPSSDEVTGSLNNSPRSTSPTSSTASSKRLVHQEDFAEPKRKKPLTDSGENSVLHQPISTTPPSSSTRPLIVQPSSANIIISSNTMSVEPNKNLSSKVKVEEDIVTSQTLVATHEVLGQNEKKNDDKLKQIQSYSIENNGKYWYGFETDGMIEKSYYMDQLEDLNVASLFPGVHIGSPILMVNDTHGSSQQSNDHLPYLNGEMDPIDDIQFD
ncbi:unnamed protein product [Withania somnifera]